MSVRYLKPHNVSHGETAIANCREVTMRNQCTDVRHLSGDGSVYPELAVGLNPVCEVSVVTEDLVVAMQIAPGTRAELSFDIVDAEGGDDKTITAANAFYLGPSEEVDGVKPAAGAAAMNFICFSSDGGTSPVSIT